MKRRDFLRASGVAVALPGLEALGRTNAPRRRLVCMNLPLGLHPAYLFPSETGRKYASTPYLDVLKDFRDDLTLVSGMHHPGMSPGFGHQASASFLTGAPGAGRPGFKNSISLDQLAAEQIGDQTRFRTLVMTGGGTGLSWTRTGALVPADTSPAKIFKRFFLADSPAEKEARARQLADGRSALDDVRAEARKRRSGLGARDREKLDEYLESIRELEGRLAKDELWLEKPKPKVDAKPPKDISNNSDLVGRTRQMLDLAALALETDSTRLVTVMLGGSTRTPPIEGVTLGHHDLSHHGKDPAKLAQLKLIEIEMMKLLRDFLVRLKSVRDGGSTLLDQTTVFVGSNLGDGSSHSIKNLPALIAGGGYRHGQHLAVEADTPLCNLYVTFLQRLGIRADRFGTSTGPLKGLAMAD